MMPRKKPTSNLVNVDFGNKQIKSDFDFSFIFNGVNRWFSQFGLKEGMELQFKYVDDFFDGDFIAFEMENSHYFGFAYHLNNSILIGTNDYKPHPRNEIGRIGKLVTPIKLSRTGKFKEPVK